MRDIIQDFLDSPVGIILAGAAMVLAATFGMSAILTSCGQSSVACVEAGGNWDSGNGVCTSGTSQGN